MSLAHRRIGIAYINSNNFEKCIYHEQLSYNLSKRINFKKGMTNALNNLGVIYGNNQIYDIAIDYYLRALKNREELHDSVNLGPSYYNVGLIYEHLNNFSKAKEYHFKALHFSILTKNIIAEAHAYDGLAAVYAESNKIDSALNFYQLSLNIHLKSGSKLNIIKSYNHLGYFYNKNKSYDVSIAFLKKAILLLTNYDSPLDFANANFRLSDNYYRLSKLDSATFFGLIALHAYDKENDINGKSNVCGLLAMIFESKKNYLKAYEYLNLNKKFNDSIIYKNNSKSIIQKQMQYEFDKKLLADSIQFVEKEKINLALLTAEKAKIAQANTLKYTLIGSIILVLGFLGFVYSRFKITKEQNKIISNQNIEVNKQKHVIEEKQREIIDSINYAKRIQGAVLSSEATINQYLNHFIYYKPKDIIAGDFYFFEDYNNHLFIAACDCTGHGVPGAMVSVVCSNALTKAIKEFKLSDPAEIFNKTRELVIENFKGSNQEIKDGMDASMIVFNKITKQVTWCGANNPLWIINNGLLTEFKPDKQPIAYYDYTKTFTTVNIETKPNTIFYLITDGYSDQFGGTKGKKYKCKELKELLIMNSSSAMFKQKNSLNIAFESWKGDLEQVDDVTIFGFEFNANSMFEVINPG